MRTERFMAGALTAIVIALTPAATRAATSDFCRTTTVAPPSDFDPIQGCFTQGVPLYHPSQCLPYHLLATPSPEISQANLSDALARVFGTWTSAHPSVACSPGITAVELAPVADTKVADYVIGEHGHNVIGVVEGPWPHLGGSDTLALATLTFDADSGEIFDADLELRSDVPWASTGAPTIGPQAVDLDSVLLHEAGHVFGLAHDADPGSVMQPTYAPGMVTRTLGVGDQRALCAIYPNRQTRVTAAGNTPSTACDLSLSTGSSGSACDPAITHGCSIGSSGALPGRTLGPHARLAWLAVVAGLVALSRARASRRRRAIRP